MAGHSKAARRGGYVIGILALAALGAALLAPSAPAGGSATAGERWQGTWRFQNDFGRGTMHLCEKNGFVFGVYGNEDGGGKIWGDLSNRRTRWAGKYQNTTGNTRKAPFYAVFDTGATFIGEFRDCGRFTCGPWHEWSGERLDRDPAGNFC